MIQGTIRAALAAALLAICVSDAQAQMVVTPSTFDFGTVPVGAALSLNGTVKNAGPAGSVYRLNAITPCPGTSMEFGMPALAVGRTWEYGQIIPFSVSYAPIDATADAGCFDLLFVDPRYLTSPAGGSVVRVSVSGAAAGDPVPRLASTGGFYFGNVALGSTATRTVQLQNVGAADLVIDAVSVVASIATGELALDAPALPAILAPGTSLAVTLAYTPGDVGVDNAAVEVVSNDPAAPVRRVPVNGAGFDPNATLDLDIVTVDVAATAKVRKPLTLSVSTANAGTLSGSVTIEVVAVQNGVEVYRSSLPVFSAVGDAVVYAGFGFTPRSKGVVTWTVTVTDGDSDVDVATADTVVR